MSLDPKKRYLRQEVTGRLYPWSKSLAARKDMREFDPKTNKVKTDLNHVQPTVPIKLQGKTFMVAEELHEILTDMLVFIDELKAKNGGGDVEKTSKLGKKGK